MLLQVAPGGSSVERESEPGNCIADSAVLIQLQSDFDELRWKHAQMEANLRQAYVSLPPLFPPSLPRFFHPPNPLRLVLRHGLAWQPRMYSNQASYARMYWNQVVDQTCPPPLFKYYLSNCPCPI
jgi:hypothetical protein